MSFTIALYIAAAAAPSGLTEAAELQQRGAQVASARVAVRIMRTAVLRDGVVVFGDGKEGPRTQQVRREGRVTYEFE